MHRLHFERIWHEDCLRVDLPQPPRQARAPGRHVPPHALARTKLDAEFFLHLADQSDWLALIIFDAAAGKANLAGSHDHSRATDRKKLLAPLDHRHDTATANDRLLLLN